MSRRQLEAFSDGVIVVALTVVALNLLVPDPGCGRLRPQFGDRWPTLIPFLARCLIVGFIGVNDHVLVQNIAAIDCTVLAVGSSSWVGKRNSACYWRFQNLVGQLAEADERTSEGEERDVALGIALVANREFAVPRQPRQIPLHHPADAPQPLTQHLCVNSTILGRGPVRQRYADVSLARALRSMARKP
jgi:hypothetical protein